MSKPNFDKELRRKKNFQKKFEMQLKIKEVSPLAKLNDEQLRAVYSKNENNLIIASAGTGKTSTIVGRVIHLLKQGIKPEEIILLTFTSKAGKEMLERLTKHIGDEVVNKIFAGTFHSYGKMLMNKAKEKTKLKTPKEMISVLSAIMADKYFLEKFNEPYSSKTVMDYIGLYESSRAKNESFGEWLIEELSKKAKKSKNNENIQSQISQAKVYNILYETYEKTKLKNLICDFNDLLKYIPMYYSAHENKIKQIIIDEYQDTNNLQNQILESLQKKKSRLFAVGDYDQSIYGFNGSNIDAIKSFSSIYPNVGIYKLCKNYRSSKHILNIANSCIEHNERIIEKELLPMKKGDFEKPKFHIYTTLSAQNEDFVNLVEKSGYEYDDIAILSRTNNSSNLLEAILIENDIPTVRVKSGSFFDGEDISTLISMFKIITNSPITIVDFLKITIFTDNVIPRNVSLKLFENTKNNSVVNVLKNYASANKGKKEVDIFIKLIEDCRGVKTPLTIFKLIYETSLYNFLLNRTIKKAEIYNNSGSENIRNQIEKKHELLLRISKNCLSVKQFLQKLLFSSKEEENSYGVKIMTVHASKGLEFKCVIVTDLVEGKFPNLKLCGGEDRVDEERRLFYVATTRAEERLLLTSYKIDDLGKKDKKVAISRFIGESGLAYSTIS